MPTRIPGSDPKQEGQIRSNAQTTRKVSLTESPGIYNRNPSPGLGQYPADVGKGDIDVKFADTGVGDANKQHNQLRQATGVNRTGKAPLVATSNMMKKKNTYAKAGMTRQGRK